MKNTFCRRLLVAALSLMVLPCAPAYPQAPRRGAPGVPRQQQNEIRTNAQSSQRNTLAAAATTASSTPSFAPAVSYNSGGYNALGVAVADLNGDGKPDLVVLNQCIDGACATGSVGVLLGNGDGTFQTAVIYATNGYNFYSGNDLAPMGPNAVAVADVNGDGKPDIIVAEVCLSLVCTTFNGSQSGGVDVLLGNGDGTFQAAVSYPSGGVGATSVTIADVNGDGKPDVVVSNQYYCTSNCNGHDGNIGILVGNGDGTFQPVVSYPSGTNYVGTNYVGDSFSVAAGDLRGSGKPDLVVTNINGISQPGDSAVSVLLNDGFGAFTPAVIYDSGGFSTVAIAIGDLNGDGKPDLVVANSCASDTSCANGVVGVLLGNGDGTFQPAVAYSAGFSGNYLALADINGDGNLDVVAGTSCGTSGCPLAAVSIMLGNGDGTLQAPVSSDAGYYLNSIAVADVNGDHQPDLIVAGECLTSSNCGAGGVFVLLNQTAPAKSSSTTTLVPSMNPSFFDQTVALTATVAGSGSTTPTGSVMFSNGSISLGSSTLSGGVATLIIAPAVNTGTYSITASYGGDSNFNGSTSNPVSQVVNAEPSTCSVNVTPNPLVAFQPGTISTAIVPQYGGAATGTVSFSANGTPVGAGTLAADAASLATQFAVGTYTVSAAYSGDTNVNSSQCSATQVVNQASTRLTITPSQGPIVFGQTASFTVVVSPQFSGTPSGTVAFSSASFPTQTLPLNQGTVIFSTSSLGIGTDIITATYGGDTNFTSSSAAAAQVVAPPPMAPAITSASIATFTVLAPGSFLVTTTGVPNPSLAISSGMLPTGLNFMDNGNGTGTLSGTPAAGTVGSYSLTFSATNGIGTPALQSFTLTVNQAPAITSGSGTTFTEGVPGSFTLSATGSPIPALSESPTLPTGLNFVDNGDGTATLSGTPGIGTQGSYPIAFVAANGVGTNATQNFTLAINLGPAVTSGSGTTFTEQVPGSFLVTTQGFPLPSLTETGQLPTGVTFTDNHDGTATLAGTPTVGTSNIYPITITANNGVGTPTTQTFTLTVNSTAAITSGSTTTFTVGSAGFFSITTVGTPAPTLTETGSLPTGVTFMDNGNGTGTLSGTPAAGTANNYPLAITANNGVGTPAMQNFTLVVNQGAAILSGNGTTFTVGVSGTFTVMTGGSPTPSLTETPPLPAGVTFVDNGDGTGTLSGTPAAGTGGAYPLTFTANNGVDLPAMQAFTLTINQGPAITSSNTATFNELVMGSFVVTSTGNPIPALSKVGNLPNGAVFMDNGDGTAFLGGIPAAGSGGQYGFTITASNGVLPSATQTFTLIVVPALTFTSPSNASFTAGSQSLFTVTTAGTPLPTVTYSGNLPGGIVFTPSSTGTATLSGVPQVGTEGSYPITFTASNGTGASATQNFTLTVMSSGESVPVITSANHTTFAIGLAPGHVGDPYNSFEVTTTGFPVPKLTAKSRTGLTISFFKDNGDGTATISFPPNVVGREVQTFTITATGADGAALAATQTFTLNIVALPPAPTFTSANHVAFTVGVPNSFTVAAGPFVDVITAAVSDGVSLTDNHDGTATLSGTPTIVRSFGITFTASNPNLNTAVRTTPYTATQTFTLAVLPATESAPAITSANNATFAIGLAPGHVGDPYNSFEVTTTGFPVPKLTAKSRTGLTISFFKDNGDGTATISFPPNVVGREVQTFTITATGADGAALAATQTFTLNIVALPPAPTFTSANHVAFTVGVPNSFTVAAGPFVDVITAAVSDGVSLTDNHDGTATLSGTPTIVRSFGITFTASNPNLNTAVRTTPYTATQTFTLAVLPATESAPAITSANNATFAIGLAPGHVGDPYNSFEVTTTGFPVPKLTAKSRTGLTISFFKDNGDGTATISFPPNVVGREVQTFTITATGAGGAALAATQTFTLNIVALPPAPTFTSANHVAFTVGVPNSFTVAAGPFVNVITAAVSDGVSLTDNHDGTATLSGTPTIVRSFGITFTASNPNLNTAVRTTPYTATQTFTLAVLP